MVLVPKHASRHSSRRPCLRHSVGAYTETTDRVSLTIIGQIGDYSSDELCSFRQVIPYRAVVDVPKW